MIDPHTLRELYPLALAEGEGVGTAYEYLAKRLLLRTWLRPLADCPRVLIAGLPEKYGSSLDFLLAAAELGAEVTVVDDRMAALKKAQSALTAAQNEGFIRNISPQFVLLESRGIWSAVGGRFDVVFSSETLQRVANERRMEYVRGLMRLAKQGAIFAPNADNPDHTTQSGLSGIGLDELRQLAFQLDQASDRSGREVLVRTDYLDMPPFPPGITRTAEQREHATSGRVEAMAMWALGYYARLEKWFPLGWRKRKAHIVYALFSHTLR